jgi:hypothetical protein
VARRSATSSRFGGHQRPARPRPWAPRRSRRASLGRAAGTRKLTVPAPPDAGSGGGRRPRGRRLDRLARPSSRYLPRMRVAGGRGPLVLGVRIPGSPWYCSGCERGHASHGPHGRSPVILGRWLAGLGRRGQAEATPVELAQTGPCGVGVPVLWGSGAMGLRKTAGATRRLGWSGPRRTRRPLPLVRSASNPSSGMTRKFLAGIEEHLRRWDGELYALSFLSRIVMLCAP